MRFRRFAQIAVLNVTLGLVAVETASAQQATATAEQILKNYRPAQQDVETDSPTAAEIAKCRVELERTNGAAGYVVYGPAGQILRKITDINGDGTPDLYRYYRMGLEVYRDIDTNKNAKANESRWMNCGGTRWGVDQDEDGRIDSWKVLSAQEAARIAVEAMIRGDMRSLSSVMVSSEDIRALQINASVGKQLADASADLTSKVRAALTASKVLNSRSTWVRFDPPVPGLIPSEDGRAAKDLTVYENAMAIVQNGEKHDLVMVGEMVLVNDVWKLTQLPVPLEGNGPQTIQLGGILMQPQLTNGVADGDAMSEEMQGLLATLQKVDEAQPAPDATPALLARYNVQRADIIEKLMLQPQREEDRLQWIRQFADGVAAATQTGEYAEGLQRLAALQEKVKANDDLLGYVFYRRLLGEYAVRLKTENAEQRDAAQKWWLEQLEVYAKRWPKAEDTSDAIVQLAISLELMGRLDDAKGWYTTLARDYARTNAGIRARGALRRLSLTGSRLDLQGRSLNGQTVSSQQYTGRVTLVVFWATWAMPFTDDLPKLNEVYKKYQGSGFEILGVNLDSSADTIPAYLKQHGVSWQSIRDAGGTDGALARDYGIVSVPTMFIVDKTGVVAGSITTANLEIAVTALLKGEKLEATRQSAANPATNKPQ